MFMLTLHQTSCTWTCLPSYSISTREWLLLLYLDHCTEATVNMNCAVVMLVILHNVIQATEMTTLLVNNPELFKLCETQLCFVLNSQNQSRISTQWCKRRASKTVQVPGASKRFPTLERLFLWSGRRNSGVAECVLYLGRPKLDVQ